MTVAEEEPEKKCPRCGQRDRTTFTTCRYCGTYYSAAGSEPTTYTRQYPGWQALFLSFYSPAFYQEVRKCWTGVGYLYLCSMLFFVSLVYALKFQFADLPVIEQISQQFFESFSAQMPKVTLENGHLSIDKPSPYTIKVPFQRSKGPEQSLTIIFDTRDQTAFTSQSDDVILVTSDSIFRGKRNCTPGGFGSTDNYILDKSKIKQMWDSVSSFFPWASTALFLLYFPLALILCIFQTLIYSLIGKLFADKKATYGTVVRLCSVALTPAIVLELILRLSAIPVPYWALVSILIALAYLYFAVISTAEN